MRKYYEAYDDRYLQVHEKNLQWASYEPSAIVGQVIARYGITKESAILELGCGEGRDAIHLLKNGYNLTATDISPEAIRYCRAGNPEFADRYQTLDCVAGEWNEKYDFIYAVAVIHMLVEEDHRAAFYRFIREHLTEGGAALICTMGDGTVSRKSDISTAFDLQERSHGESGEKLLLAGTSCRMVTREEFLREIRESGLEEAEHGLTSVAPDFPVMMYAVVK
jgi:cyclopropane fatty-acyl-phospholipid synthase-like methyltransferase